MVGGFFIAHSATVLAGVKLVRPVGRSNLTPAAVRRIEQLRRSHPLGMTLLTHDPSTDKKLEWTVARRCMSVESLAKARLNVIEVQAVEGQDVMKELDAAS
jgi:hypothetical protein